MKKSDIKDPKKKKSTKELVRTVKSIVVDSEKSNFIDKAVIKKRYCNSLNYTKLSKDFKNIQLLIGVTSPKKGEGKTVIASNLAVSLALAYNKKTVLVDMNLTNPCLHEIFGTKLRPGLVESFHNGNIFLTQTKMDHLYLLPAGNYLTYSFGLESTVSIRDIIYSLQKEFEIIILDMSSVLPIENFPVVCVNELDGILAVIDTQKTKYEDVEKMFKHIKEDQILGFVFNKVDQ